MNTTRKYSARSNFGFTIASSAVAALSLAGFSVLAANLLSADDLGLVQSVRSFAAFFVPLLTLSQALAIQRYSAFSPPAANAISSGFGIFFILATSCFLLLLLFSLFAQAWLSWQIVTGLLLCSLLGGARLLEASFRADFRYLGAFVVKVGSSIAILGFGLGALLVLPTAQSSLWGLCVGGLTVNVAGFVWLASVVNFVPGSGQVKQQVWFGVGRVPAGLLKSANYTLPFVVFTASSDFESAAVFSLGILFVRSSEAMFAGVSPAVLQHSAVALMRSRESMRMKSTSDEASLGVFIAVLLEAVLVGTAAAMVVFVYFREPIVSILFGDAYVQHATAIATLASVMIPQAVTTTLRGAVDAVSDSPINTYVLSASLAVQILLGCFFGGQITLLSALTYSLLVATLISALMTLIVLRHQVWPFLSFSEFAKNSVLLLAVVLSCELVVFCVDSRGSPFLPAFSAIMVVSYLLFFLRPRWLSKIMRKRA